MASVQVKTGERFEPDGRGGTRHVHTCSIILNGIKFSTDTPDHAMAMRLAVETAKVLHKMLGTDIE